MMLKLNCLFFIRKSKNFFEQGNGKLRRLSVGKYLKSQREFIFSGYTPPGFTKATKEIWLLFYARASHRRRPERKLATAKVKPGGTGNLPKMEKIGMANFYYVYFLVDVATESHCYTGVTEDLTASLAKHNAGEVPRTSKFKPWKIETAIAFSSKEKVYAFEAYLKTHSGRSFSHRHF